MSRRTHKNEIYLANEGSGVAILSTDLGHKFGSDVGNEFGVKMRERRPHTSEFAYDIVRIHSLMIYTELIAYNIVGYAKVALLRCFPFFQSSRLETIKLLDTK